MLDTADLPGPRRELGLLAASGVVMIEMLPAVALRKPEERAVVQPVHRPRAFDPGLGLIAEQPLHRAVVFAGRELDEVEPGLDAVLDVAIGSRAVGPPADVADQERVGGIVGEVGPLDRPAGAGDHSEADLRVRLTRPRIVGLVLAAAGVTVSSMTV